MDVRVDKIMFDYIDDWLEINMYFYNNKILLFFVWLIIIIICVW